MSPRRGGSLALAIAAFVVAVAAIELVFHYVVRSSPRPPGVFFQTERPNIRLLAYDDEYNGSADYDLRRDRPFARLKNIGNTEDDGRYNRLHPDDVPVATSIEINEFNLRGRSLFHLETLQDSIDVTLVVGDSFCYGQGIRVEDRFSNVLERQLARSVRPQALVNACMGGLDVSGIAPMARRLTRVVGRVDRVIYAYNLNDAIQGSELQEMARQSRATQLFLNDAESGWVEGDGPVPVADDRFFRWARPLLRLCRRGHGDGGGDRGELSRPGN